MAKKVLKKTAPKQGAKNTPQKVSKTKATKAGKVETRAVVAEIVDDEQPYFESSSTQEAFDQAEVISSSDDIDSSLIPIAQNQTPQISSSKALATTDPLAMYLAEIRNYPLLSKEEEIAIAKKYYEDKDPEAAQTLVKANLRFVVKVAAEYSKFGAKMIDLIQEGNVGLMHAVREFNPYKGARLITYAVWWIRGYIQEYLMRQHSMVRIGTTQNQRKLFYQLQKEKDSLDAMGLEPSIALISSRLGIPEDEVKDMAQRLSGRDVSLDKPLDDESGVSLGDMQKNNFDQPLDEQLAQSEMIEILKQKIEALRPQLTEKETIILEERILADEPLTLQEIGDKYKITREAVRQTEARLMNKIKKLMIPE